MLEQTSTRAIAAALLAPVVMSLLLSSQILGSTASYAEAAGATVDEFGIQKIYQTSKDGKEWYVDMDDPKSDPNFRNLDDIKFDRNSDGSWQISEDSIRMEAWSPANQKWLNVEMTAYFKVVETSSERDGRGDGSSEEPLFQMYSRGGHHTDDDPCLGSAYKARLYANGTASWVKEVTHPAYSEDSGIVKATTTPIDGRWIGFKSVVYNFVENGQTYVRLESYIDDDVNDASGNLVIKNNWKLASVMEDRGGWAPTDGDFDSSCDIAKDAILTESGGTEVQNLVAWRTDDTTLDFNYLTIREIEPPTILHPT